MEKQYATPANQPFTIADFAIPNQRIAIRLDGLVFHTSDRLRRDKVIERRREALKPVWEVFRFTACDLRGSLAVDKILSAMN